MRRRLSLLTLLATLPVLAQTVNPSARTITTSNFSVTWNTGGDTEAITTLDWKGQPNITSTLNLDTCNDGTAIEYFGNSYAPPDPGAGGLVLVGGGTVTPPGKLPWAGQILSSGIVQVIVNSNSSNCPPSSAGVNVQTTYRFVNPRNAGVNWFQVQRVFDFTNPPFLHDFRPYMPRLSDTAGYTEVLYPTTTGTLQTTNVYSCPYGCTGPKSAPGAALLTPTWDPYQGWLAVHDPTTLQGVVVKRENSLDPQGNPITPQLWIDTDDNDNSQPDTNASSFLLLSPASGFYGGLVTEVETLCFYNSAIWTPSLVAPLGCRVSQLSLAPSTLTFPAQSIGVTSLPQTALLKNIGTSTVTIVDLVASGDFAQTNNCPTELSAGEICTIDVVFRPSFPGIQSGSVSIFDALGSSPSSLTLAGLGASTQ